MAEQQTTDTHDTDANPRGPREVAYDSLIAPLMTQIIQACKDHGIPVVCKFELDKDEDDQPLFCTTIIVNREDSAAIKQLAVEAEPRPAHVFAFTITSTKPAQEG